MGVPRHFEIIRAYLGLQVLERADVRVDFQCWGRAAVTLCDMATPCDQGRCSMLTNDLIRLLLMYWPTGGTGGRVK